jgi:Ni/Co efflux regulator RcnB
MRKTILTILVASLFAASTAQMAAAAERHHVRKIDRATSSEQFRNANNAVRAPAQPSWYPNYSDYSEGHMNMVGH